MLFENVYSVSVSLVVSSKFHGLEDGTVQYAVVNSGSPLNDMLASMHDSSLLLGDIVPVLVAFSPILNSGLRDSTQFQCWKRVPKSHWKLRQSTWTFDTPKPIVLSGDP